MLQRLNPLELSVDREGWWFEHCVMVVGLLAAEGAKIVSWPWLCLLRGWDSLIMAVTGKFEIFIMHICHPNMHIKAQYTLNIF